MTKSNNIKKKARMWWGVSLVLAFAVLLAGCALLEPTAANRDYMRVSGSNYAPDWQNIGNVPKLSEETVEEEYTTDGQLIRRVATSSTWGVPQAPRSEDITARGAALNADTGFGTEATATGRRVDFARNTTARPDAIEATVNGQIARTETLATMSALVAEGAVRGAVEGLGIVNARMIRSSEERTARRISDNETRRAIAEIETARGAGEQEFANEPEIAPAAAQTP